MARKARKSSMKKGTCKKVAAGHRCVCRLKNGQVRFKKCSKRTK